MHKGKVYIGGLDVGTKGDPTAFTLSEPFTSDPHPFELHLVTARRFPLGLEYPDIVERLAKLFGAMPRGTELVLAVDTTGVGLPVGQYIRKELREKVPRETRVFLVTSTGGHAQTKESPFSYRVSKSILVSGAQLKFQQRRLKIPDTLPLLEEVVRELQAFKQELTKSERELTWRGEGAHDDLVLSLCCLIWVAEHSWRSLELQTADPSAQMEKDRESLAHVCRELQRCAAERESMVSIASPEELADIDGEIEDWRERAKELNRRLR